jgi:hypothetical protein
VKWRFTVNHFEGRQGCRLNLHRIAIVSAVWETDGMTKRKFRIVKREENFPVLGVCEYCNAEFAANSETIGRPKDAHAYIQKQFIAHKCKRLDASKNAVRVVSEGVKSH